LSVDALAGLAAPSLRVLQISYCGAGTDAALETAARMWPHSLEGRSVTVALHARLRGGVQG
jgi:hypothetical protein